MKHILTLLLAAFLTLVHLPALAATQPYPFTASFPGLTGQAANLNLLVTDAAGISKITTATFTEKTDAAGNAITGTYKATLQIDPTWAYPLEADVTVTGQAGVIAIGFIRAPEQFDAAGYVKTDPQLGTITTVTAPVIAASVTAPVTAGNLPSDYQQRGVAVTLPALPAVTLAANQGVLVTGYAAGQDPASYCLVTPANKLSTSSTGLVKLAGGEKLDFVKTLMAYQIDPLGSAPLTYQNAVLLAYENLVGLVTTNGLLTSFYRNDNVTPGYTSTLAKTGNGVTGRTPALGTVPATPVPVNP